MNDPSQFILSTKLFQGLWDEEKKKKRLREDSEAQVQETRENSTR